MAFQALVDATDDLGDSVVRRQAHQLILSGHGAVGQRRLTNSKVLVIGADEIGAPAIALLADSGVGLIGIADAAQPPDAPRSLLPGGCRRSEGGGRLAGVGHGR